MHRRAYKWLDVRAKRKRTFDSNLSQPLEQVEDVSWSKHFVLLTHAGKQIELDLDTCSLLFFSSLAKTYWTPLDG
jgi:hypothetical protein